MTYMELFYKATRLIDNGEITLGEYEEMTKPLDREIEQVLCDDAVSRQAVLDRKYVVEVKNMWHMTEKIEAVNVDDIKALPSVNPQPKTGHWILADIQSEEDIDNDNYRYICSECQHSDIHDKNIEVPYCWNCGAKMEGEEKE